MNVKSKVCAVAIIPLIIIAVIAIVGLFVSRHELVTTVNQSNIKVQAALEMEIFNNETTKNVLDFLSLRDKKYESRYQVSLDNFNQYLNQYKQQKLSQVEQKYLSELENYYNQYRKHTAELITVEANKIKQIILMRSLLNDKLEKLLDDEWQKNIKAGAPQFVQKQEALLEIEINVHELISAVRGYVIDDDRYFKGRITDGFNDIVTWTQKLEKTTLSEQEKKWLDKVKSYSDQAYIVVNKIVSLEDSKHEAINAMEQVGEKIDFILSENIEKLAKQELEQTQAMVLTLNIWIVAILLLICIISILSIWWLAQRYITSPILQLRDAAEKMAQGETDYDINTDSKDEIGELSVSFKKVLQNAKNLSKAAKAIGIGELDAEIPVRSDNDTLGNALALMRDNLKNTHDQMQQNNWLKSELSRITVLSQGVQNLNELLNTMLQEIAELVHAGHGVIYLNNDEEGSNQLYLASSYAYKKRKNIDSKIKFGEGLVGQAALEKKTILLTQVPGNYIQINSGLGEDKPLNIIVLPIIFDDVVYGVIELAAFHEFNEVQIELLDKISSILAIMVSNLKSRQKTTDLLKESQAMTEELQSQQEELRSANEELEEKTRILSENEDELRAQSEELQSTNEELEEKSESLQQQKRDIEEKNKNLEEISQKLEKKAKEVEIASKYKSEFLANMSHELRTPLNSLLILAKGFADNEEGNLTDDQVEEGKIIYSGGQDLLNLINDILDLSKVEAGKLKLINENVHIEDIFADLNRQFLPLAKNKNIDFITEKEPSAPDALYTDGHRLEQVLKNFLSNAIKFTKEGSITLKVYRPEKQDYKNSKLLNTEVIAFSVKDSGIGIPFDKQNEIFEAFQQADGSTSRNFGGTGLGLAISRELSRLLGGEIELISQENRGSEFIVYLPVKKTESSSSEHEVSSVVEKTQQESHSEKASNAVDLRDTNDDRAEIKPGDQAILIIEDDKTFANVLAKVAREKQFKALISFDGERGIQLAQQYSPLAIILDLGLPDIDGRDVLKKLKENPLTSEIPVHIISGHSELIETEIQGAISQMMKPVSSEQLKSIFSNIGDSEQNDKKVLLVVNDSDTQNNISNLLGKEVNNIEKADTAKDAIGLLTDGKFDCVIIDLDLPDMDGINLLRTLENNNSIKMPPTIVYTARNISQEEYDELCSYSITTIVKGSDSADRLLSEVHLFLHTVENNLPQDQRVSFDTVNEVNNVLIDKKVLLVDDDMRNIFALSKILKKQQIQVVMAPNGKVAIDKLQSEDGIDLVIMDIMMPVMDGFEAMKRIRKMPGFTELPIIALTAKAMAEDRNKCLECGANDYITKPVDIDKLISMLKVWLGK